MFKIAIINQPLFNRGDQAAHFALLRYLNRFTDFDITVLSIHDSHNSVIEFANGATGVNYITFPPFKKNMRRYFRRIMSMPDIVIKLLQRTPSIKAYNEIIKEADFVLCAPGGICMGGYKNWVHIWNLANAIALNKRTGIIGRSIGPFFERTRRERIFKKRSIQILKSVDYLSLRDRFSQRIADDLGISYIPTVDTAFAVKPEINNFPQELSFLLKEPYVVFVPNQLYRWHPYYKQLSGNNVDCFYLKVIRAILERGVQVIMLPQLFGSEKGDRNYFIQLADTLESSRVCVLADIYHSDIQQFIIKQALFLVGARYHSVIFSIINQTPFWCLSYEHKMEDTLQSLSLDHFSVDLQTVFEQGEYDRLIEGAIDNLINRRQPIREELHLASQKAQTIVNKALSEFINQL